MRNLRSIFKLTAANIKSGKGAFKSVFFLIMIVIFSFSPTVSNNDNVTRQTDEAFGHAEVGDLVITLDEADLTGEIKNCLDGNKHVTSWRADYVIKGNGGFEAGDKKSDNYYRLAVPDGHYRLINDDVTGFEENADTREPEKGEVFISYGLHESMKIGKGDILTLKTYKGDVDLKVSGIMEEPLYGSPLIDSEKMYISKADLEKFEEEYVEPAESPYRMLEKVYIVNVNSDGELSDVDLADELNKESGIINNSSLYITAKELKSATMIFSNIGTKILIVFLILLTAIVAISLYNNISSSVEMDYTELGILKSQGFTSGDIRLSYILQYAIALTGGALLGVPLSIPLTRYAGKAFIRLTGIITFGDVSFGKCIIFALALSLICLLSVFLAVFKVGRISPVKAINGGMDEAYFSSMINVTIRSRAMIFFIALRQITSRIRNYAGVIVITALLSFFMISISQMIENLNSSDILGGVEDTQVAALLFDNFEYGDMDKVRNFIKEKQPDSKLMFQSKCDLMVGKILYNVQVTDELGIETFVKPIDGRAPQYGNEIALTDITAEELGKDIGDKVTVRSDKGEKEYVIVGKYQSLSEFGRTMTISYEGAEELGCPVKNMAVISESMTDPKSFAKSLNDEFGDKMLAKEYESSGITETISGIMDSVLDLVIAVIYGVSSVFALFVIYMICKKEILRERHDLGVFKAVGFGNASLRYQFALRFLTIAVTGSIIGTALAVLLTEKLYVLMFRTAGITNFVGSLDYSKMPLPVAIVIICFFAFAYLCSRSISRVDIKQLITE